MTAIGAKMPKSQIGVVVNVGETDLGNIKGERAESSTARCATNLCT